MVNQARDIFDELDQIDPFDDVSTTEDDAVESIKNQLTDLLTKFDSKDRKRANGQLTAEIKSFVKTELAKIKPTQNVIERTIEKNVPVHLQPLVVKTPPQIIKEVRVEVQKESAVDLKPYAEKKTVEELRNQIEGLTSQLENIRQMLPLIGGSGVIGLPNPDGNAGKTLQVVNGQWKPVTAASGGGSSSDAYTPTNVSTDRSYNASSTSLDEIANVLGSLIASLQGAGIIQ